MLRAGDQGVQPDRDARQAGFGAGQLAPGVEDGKPGLVRAQAGSHHVPDEQPDAERRRHDVIDIPAAALGRGHVT
jgi:hypothetical protein